MAVHAVALVLLLNAAPVPAARLAGADVLTAFSLAGPIAPAKPEQKSTYIHPQVLARNVPATAPRVRVASAPDQTMALPIAGPIAVADILKLAGSSPAVTPVPAQAARATGGACDLTDRVQSALIANPDVRARLPMIPAGQRSVANAIMVWNAGWLHTDDAAANTDYGQPAYAAIRDAVAGAVMAASDQCRSQIQSGPRLVVLSGERGQATVLALGSGQWTWQQVADTALPPAAFAQRSPAQFSAANTAMIPHASLKTGEE